jgi:hypothetical protein
VGDAPPGVALAGRRPEVLERYLEEALRKAGVPDRVGLFFEEQGEQETDPLLPAAAALAVLARRSGPLYLPSRRFECSLVHPRPFILFFPEESR